MPQRFGLTVGQRVRVVEEGVMPGQTFTVSSFSGDLVFLRGRRGLGERPFDPQEVVPL